MPERPPPALLPFLALAALLAAVPAGAATIGADEATRAYVRGRLALSSDDYAAASRYFAEALQEDEDTTTLYRSLETAMLTGDARAAARLARQIGAAGLTDDDAPPERRIVTLVQAALAASRGNWNVYNTELATLYPGAPPREPSERVLALAAQAWGKAGARDIDGALAIADPAGERGIVASYLREQRANILALAGRWAEAAAIYQQLASGEGSSVARLRLAAAATLLEATPDDIGAREKAFLLVGGGPTHDPLLMDARVRLLNDPGISGRKLAGPALVTSPRQGLGLLFVRLAADLSRARSMGPALDFGRLATFVDPALADGWLVVSDTLARTGRHDLALAALDRAPAKNPWSDLVELRRAEILAATGQTTAARAILAGRAERPESDSVDWERLADLERRVERMDEAVAAYGRALERVPDDSGRLAAQLHFLRGSALESSGDWARAEPDLRKAVELADDNPIYLNYLGYSLLDRNLELAESYRLIARAFELAPQSGAIMDSMGWAEHVAGNGEQAVLLLEQAQSAEPADPTVADHLGDALWGVGRRIEARYAWTAAAALAPGPELARRIRHKLDFGPGFGPDAAGGGQ